MISTSATQNWLTLTIFFLIVLLVLLHYLFRIQFKKFIAIFKDNEYFIEYVDNRSSLIGGFDVMLFFLQLGIFTLLVSQIQIKFFNLELTGAVFFRNTLVLLLFFIVRFLVGKILAFIFKIDRTQGVLSFVKYTYLSKTAIYVFPFVLLLYYFTYSNSFLLAAVIVLTMLLLLFYYVKISIKNQKIIIANMFYFILYLCALEITPLVYLFGYLDIGFSDF